MAEEHVPLPSPPLSSGMPPRAAVSANGSPAPAPPGQSSHSLVLHYLTLGVFGRGKADPAHAPPPTHVSRIDGPREVVETIVFVVVLVLLLKSFVAEAFVIPTGSMATTLWGYQKYAECPQCKHKFPVNCSQEVDPQRGHAKQDVTSAVCPNCRLVVTGRERDQAKAAAPRRRRGWVASLLSGLLSDRDEDDALGPANTGDRVLVAKFLYDLPWKKPRRHDVVVFKYPERPQEGHTPMNYIKRLIGLGGETIAIYYGNLYVLPADRSPKYDDYLRTRWEDLWRSDCMHGDDAVPLFRKGEFRIIRKDPDQMLSMRRLVYDNDHPASDRPGDVRWKASGVWAEAVSPRGFKHVAAPEGPSWLRYSHALRDNNGKPSLVTDFMGYNTANGSVPVEHWVGDLMLEAEVKVEKAEGELVFELSRGTDRFRAVWDLTSGVCVLRHLRDYNTGQTAPGFDTGESIAERPTPLKAPGTYLVRFANFDDRLTMWVNKEMPFGVGVETSPSKEPGPTRNDLEPAGVAANGSMVALTKLKVWRDTYYTPPPEDRQREAETRERTTSDWTEPNEWDGLRNLQPRTLYVQPGHYLCMGDNSPQSSDSRMWGLVPERLMLGRALAVYYPFYCPVWPLSSPVNRVGPIE